MTFGEWLRAKRASRGLTQRQLAARAGLSDGMVGRLELDDVGWSAQTLESLARALAEDNATPEEFERVHREVRAASAGLIDELERVADPEREAWNGFYEGFDPGTRRVATGILEQLRLHQREGAIGGTGEPKNPPEEE